MTATVTLSVEIEMGWGVNGIRSPAETPKLPGDGAVIRAALDRFLRLCDEFDVPVSFDVVGHLLLDECEGTHEGPHREGWFASDPGTDRRTSDLYYGPDMIRAIEAAETGHEICTHTFSHVPCGEASREVIEWELRTAREIHSEFGLPEPVSFVPPLHQRPPHDLLRENGIEIVRVASDDYWRQPDGKAKQAAWYAARVPPVEAPRIVDGVVETYVPTYDTLTAAHLGEGVSEPRHWLFRAVPGPVRQSFQRHQNETALRHAAETDGHLHLWTHLYSLTNEAQWPPLRSVLSTIARLRRDDEATVLTMRRLNEAVRGGPHRGDAVVDFRSPPSVR